MVNFKCFYPSDTNSLILRNGLCKQKSHPDTQVHQDDVHAPPSPRVMSQPYPMEEATRGGEWGADCSLGQFTQQPIP